MLLLNLFIHPRADLMEEYDYAQIESRVNEWFRSRPVSREQIVDFRMGPTGDDFVIAVLIDVPEKEG